MTFRTARSIVPLIALALLTLALPLLPLASADPARAQTVRRPNLVLIVLDDLDARSLQRLPVVDQLLRQGGTSFDNFFVTTPLCCPSRASILRGQYVHNHGVQRNLGNQKAGGFPAFHNRDLERSTVATWLRGAGYRTALVGKYLNDYPDGVAPTYVPPGWDEWYAESRGQYFNYDLNENGTVVGYGDAPEDYSTDVLAAKATDFVRRTAGTDPFFLYLAPRAPHGPVTPAPRHADAFSNVKAPRVPSFNEADVSDKPSWVQSWPRLRHERVRRIDQYYRQQLRTLLAVDDMVGNLVQALRAENALDDTYVFFTSDNGFQYGEHRLQDVKLAPYDESIRVPLLVRGPGVPAGRSEERLALNIDLAPTLADLAGADAGNFVDGRSLAPLLGAGDPGEWRGAALIELFAGKGDLRQAAKRSADADAADVGIAKDAPARPPKYQGLRTPDRLFVAYAGGERELYDMTADPYQLVNLAKNPSPERRAEIDRLSAWLDALRRCRANGCRQAEASPPDARQARARDDESRPRTRRPGDGRSASDEGASERDRVGDGRARERQPAPPSARSGPP